MQTLENTIFNFINQYQIEKKYKSILVGFSGGADSTSLLYALNNVIKKNKINLQIVAIHLNHNQRGVESDKDEKFCSDLCKNLNIDFYSYKLNSNKKLSELEARNERYNFFKIASQKFDTKCIFLAHNQNDNVETFFYRILKGTSPTGLKCILPYRKNENLEIYRPMLYIKRIDIENYLKLNKINFVIDCTNLQSDFSRNYIRNKMKTHFLHINKNYEDVISNLINIINLQEDFLDKILDKKLKDILTFDNNELILNKKKYNTKKFINLNLALKTKLISQILQENKLDWNYKKINEICTFIFDNSNLKNGKIISISAELFLFSNSQYFYIYKKKPKNEECLTIYNLNRIYEFDGHKIFFEKLNKVPNNFPKEDEDYQVVSFDMLTLPFSIRYRQNGDIIQPFGFENGKMKLKKYFINKGIFKHNRDKIILLTSKNEILWAKNIGLSNKLKVLDSSKKIYKIVIKKV